MGTILVVEDDPTTNYLVCRLIKRSGHETLSAFTGEEALSLLTRAKSDLVILDHMMPGMEGLEVLRRLRRNPDTAALPVVMYSAVADPAFIMRAKRDGACDVWLKGTFEPSGIPTAIDALLSARERYGTGDGAGSGFDPA